MRVEKKVEPAAVQTQNTTASNGTVDAAVDEMTVVNETIEAN